MTGKLNFFLLLMETPRGKLNCQSQYLTCMHERNFSISMSAVITQENSGLQMTSKLLRDRRPHSPSQANLLFKWHLMLKSSGLK